MNPMAGSSAAYQRDDFDLITRLKVTFFMAFSRHDFPVSLNGAVAVFDLQIRKQVGNGP